MSAGIASTQVGYPLAHGGEGPSNRVSADRLVGLAGAAILDAEDEEVGNPGLSVGDVTEGRGHPEFGTEVRPPSEDLGLGLPMLASGSRGGEVERSAQISLEDSSDGSCSSCQGVSWG